MAALAVVKSGILSLAPVAAVAPTVGGDTIANDGQVMLWIQNGANPTTVTVAGVPCSHGRSANAVFATLANTTNLLGPFPPGLWNDANGNLNVTYSQAAATLVAVFRCNN